MNRGMAFFIPLLLIFSISAGCVNADETTTYNLVVDVIDNCGDPLTDAEVDIYYAENGINWQFISTRTPDENGKVIYENLEEGWYRVEIYDVDSKKASEEFYLERDERITLENPNINGFGIKSMISGAIIACIVLYRRQKHY